MAVSFDTGIFSLIGINSELLIGAKLYWYESGTSTPLATYSDDGLTIPNTNPVIANAAGRFGPIYLQHADYKMVLTLATSDPTSPLVTRDPVTGITALDTLALPTGAGLIGYNFGTPNAVNRTLLQNGHDTMSINAEYGVVGSNNPGDAAKIQLALDGALVGANITADANVYKIVGDSWNQTRYFDWQLPQYAVFRGDYTSGDTHNVINIDISTTDGAGDIRNLTFRGGRIFTNALDGSTDAGGYGIAVNSQTGGLPQLGFLIDRAQISGTLGAVLFKGDFSSDSVNFSGAIHSNLLNGVDLDGVSDGQYFLFNLASGENAAYRINARAGAYNHTFEGGASVNVKGALDVVNADRWLLHNVQIEGPATANTQTLGAQVIIRGADRASIGGAITNCNFGGGDFIQRLIVLQNAYGTVVDENYFNGCNLGTGPDVDFAPLSDNTIIGNRNLFRGPRTRVTQAGGHATDASRLMRIELGTTSTRARGIWQNGLSLLDGLFSNGWSATNLEIMMLESGMVVFNGGMTGGTLTAGTTICTFPDWLRPFEDKIVMATSSNGTVHGLTLTAAGVLSPTATLPVTGLSLDNAFWMAMTLNPYNQGVA